MFPRIVSSKRKNATYEYLVISESEYVKGKGSITRNIANLGNIKKFSQKDIGNLIDGLIKLFNVESFALSKNIEILESVEHGSIIFWKKLWDEFDLSNIIKKLIKKHNNKISLAVEKYIEMIVINRCINPLSKLGCTRWIETSCYKMMKGYTDLSLHVENIYRSMDYLLQIKDELEYEIFLQLRNLFSINIRFTFYDITSTYFYTDNCPIGANGYSRDNRADREQIVIGVVTSMEGYPIKHFVFTGNTKDEKTVVEVIKELKESYRIEETTFVGDRGMITRLNLSSIELAGYDYIMGVKHRQDSFASSLFSNTPITFDDTKEYNGLLIQDKMVKVKDFIFDRMLSILKAEDIALSDEEVKQLQKQVSKLNNTKVITGKYFTTVFEKLGGNKKAKNQISVLIRKYVKKFDEEIRFIICLNKVRKNESKRKRDSKLECLYKELSDVFSKKVSPSDLEEKIAKIFDGSAHRYKKFFLFKANKKGFITFNYNKEMIELESRYDGTFVLTSNRLDLDKVEIVKSYKNLKEVEELFDDLKNFIDIRPIRHWLVNRVRAHVNICVLSLLLKRLLEIKYLKSKSMMEILEEINKSKLVRYKIKYSKREDRYKTIAKVTNSTTLQKKYFNLIGVRNEMSLEKFIW